MRKKQPIPPPLSREEVLDALRDVLTGGPTVVEFGSTEEVEALEPYVRRVTAAAGHPDAWVSDESYVSDFGLSEAPVAEMSRVLGLPVPPHTSILRLARLLREKDPEQ